MNQRFNLFISDVEKETLKDLSERANLTASELVRRMIRLCGQEDRFFYEMLPLHVSGRLHCGRK